MQALHIKPKGLCGGDAAGGGVRLFKETAVAQLRHLVAYGRGADRGALLAERPRNRTRAHRLARGDVAFDDRREYLPLPC